MTRVASLTFSPSTRGSFEALLELRGCEFCQSVELVVQGVGGDRDVGLFLAGIDFGVVPTTRIRNELPKLSTGQAGAHPPLY